jgi:hypothetical protein
MKSVKITKMAFVAVLFIVLGNSAQAQWPQNSDSNLVINDQIGAQTIPKITVTSEGGCYISWYNNTTGNYDMYLQRLDSAGVPQWPQNGILVSNHPQDSWLTDYDMAVDNQDNAVVTFNDMRNGEDWDIYAYRINPSGQFLWGSDGLTISDNPSFEADPKVIVTSAGNFVFAWQNEDTVCLRKVNSAGEDLWNPAIKSFYSEYGLTFPRIAPAENDGVILLYLMALSGGWWPPKNLYVRKFDASGNSLWANDTVAVSVAGGFGPQMRPSITSDGSGGAYVYWYDARDNNLHAYAQHISGDGNIAWTPNGVLLSTTFGEIQSAPSLVFLSSTRDVLFFFQKSDMDQNHDGIGGQRLDSTGARLWGDDGITFIPLGDPSLSAIEAQPLSDGAIFTYKQSPDDVSNCLIKAIRVNTAGDTLWPNSPILMSSLYSSKGYLESAVNCLEQVLVVWQDSRYDGSGDIYLQDINADGSLGPHPVGIPNDMRSLPSTFQLLPNFPNPFNASTIISYFLPRASDVTIDIYDILGRQVAVYNQLNQPAGYHQVIWDAGRIASGSYFCRIIAGDFDKTRKMTPIK